MMGKCSCCKHDDCPRHHARHGRHFDKLCFIIHDLDHHLPNLRTQRGVHPTGAAQSDGACLLAKDINWEERTICFPRKKLKSCGTNLKPTLFRFSTEIEALLKRRPDGSRDCWPRVDIGGNRRFDLEKIRFYNACHFFPSCDGCPFSSDVHSRQTPISITLNPISLVFFWGSN